MADFYKFNAYNYWQDRTWSNNSEKNMNNFAPLADMFSLYGYGRNEGSFNSAKSCSSGVSSGSSTISNDFLMQLSIADYALDAVNQEVYSLPENHSIITRIFAPRMEMMPHEPSLSKIPDLPRKYQQVQKVFCNTHRIESTIYCETCAGVICFECLQFHQMHHASCLSVVMDKARHRAHHTLISARKELEKREEIDEAMSRINCEEKKVRESSEKAAIEVMSSFRALKAALEEKEKELLTKIAELQEERLKSLSSKREEIQRNESSLLNVVINVTSASENNAHPVEFINLQKRLLANLEHVQYKKRTMKDIGEYDISFQGNKERVISSIEDFASIAGSSSLAPQNEKPLFKNRQLNQTMPQNPIGYGRLLAMAQGGRPIPRAQNNVVVKLRRNSAIPRTIIQKPTDDRLSLSRPWGVACDAEGHILVADRSNHRIQVFENGQLVTVFGRHGTGPLEFDRPAGIAVDSSKRVVIADKDNHRVQVTDLKGNFILEFGSKGSEPGQFNYPWDVATNGENEILISDTRNHRVQLFSAEGSFLRKFGFETNPTMWKSFDSPRGVAFTPEGDIIMTDFNNHRLLKINKGMTDYESMKLEMGGRGLQRPQGVVVDDAGNIVVADSKNHRILVFDSKGNLRWRFGGSEGSGLSEFNRPSGVALTKDGFIAVIDFGNNRVCVI